MQVALERDGFFEALLDTREEPILLRGIPFAPSAVAGVDEEAYVELRLGLLSDASDRIADSLSTESLERLGHLERLLPMKKLTPFIGAGMSASSGIPTWSAFLAQVSHGRIPEAEVQDLLDRQRYEALADLVIRTCGMALFDERVTAFDRPRPAPIHQLLPALFPGTAFTTNFDVLIEKAFEQYGTPFDLIVSSCAQWEGVAAADTQADRVLVKVHGDYRLPKSRVFAADEYDEAYAADGPLMRDLRALFAGHAVVFLGCSLASDRVMQVALEIAQQVDRAGPRHYAFLPLEEGADPDLDRERFLSERHIFPIWYPPNDGHGVLAEILWVLSSRAAEWGND